MHGLIFLIQLMGAYHLAKTLDISVESQMEVDFFPFVMELQKFTYHLQKFHFPVSLQLKTITRIQIL